MHQLLRAIYMFCKLLLLVLVLLFLLLLLHQQVHLSGSQLLPKSIMGFALPCIMSISQQLGLISKMPKFNYTPSLFKTHFLVRKSYIPASQAEPITTYQIQTPQLIPRSWFSSTSTWPPIFLFFCLFVLLVWSLPNSSSKNFFFFFFFFFNQPKYFLHNLSNFRLVDEFPVHLQESLETPHRETHKQKERENQIFGAFLFF